MYQQIFGGYCWTFIKDRFTKFRFEFPDRGRTTICVPFSDRERNLNNSGILSMRTPTRTRQTMGEMPIGLESLVLGAIAIKVRGVCCFVAYYNIREPKLTCGSHQYESISHTARLVPEWKISWNSFSIEIMIIIETVLYFVRGPRLSRCNRDTVTKVGCTFEDIVETHSWDHKLDSM